MPINSMIKKLILKRIDIIIARLEKNMTGETRRNAFLLVKNVDFKSHGIKKFKSKQLESILALLTRFIEGLEKMKQT